MKCCRFHELQIMGTGIGMGMDMGMGMGMGMGDGSVRPLDVRPSPVQVLLYGKSMTLSK
jgi:hypothetical protein